MPASTCPPTKKPSEKFMYAAATPPSGPSTSMPAAPSSRWYCQLPGDGSQAARGAASVGRMGMARRLERNSVPAAKHRRRPGPRWLRRLCVAAGTAPSDGVYTSFVRNHIADIVAHTTTCASPCHISTHLNCRCRPRHHPNPPAPGRSASPC
ncbi:protein of unknown function (plasmid) [Cupriavidus taiwanensis]|uniref:Uncharacterized protein n=1 Tax=Cupriavidus taiwanensis TaxID=164546 RepID=A0A375ISG9_9BURK|nr:hypothetical protein CBM2608_B10038 [Cupriavidus taiwanensis]SPA31849.1 hypothetical protein CBM2623_B10040 [Cupriavidus taiwanensis]SPA49327.1 hypothetical protein CBM2629_B10509 [Cupriavidus taiwanensis]SPK76392.1 protein of unknown function [Cupriavidus taiwanensis]